MTAAACACAPTGDLSRARLCSHARRCACRADLRLVAGASEGPGVTGWTWRDGWGRTSVRTWPWGSNAVAPDRWWEDLALRDVATYSVLSARERLGMLAVTHRHAPAADCLECAAGWENEPVAPPYCCGWPMWATVEGWRCRPTGTLVPYLADVTESAQSDAEIIAEFLADAQVLADAGSRTAASEIRGVLAHTDPALLPERYRP